jgi:Ca-activated chloride channel family protein
MKRSVAAFLLLTAGGLAHSMGWADLWSRPDQQTLAQRQQAFEEIQVQQYAAAAQHLQPYNDPISQYNRGIALAHAGDLKAALSAYDAVRQDKAADAGLLRDARHNRDLVAEQMKAQQQPDKSGQKDGQNAGGDKGQKDTQDDGRADKGQRDRQADGAQAQNASQSQPPPSAQAAPAAPTPAVDAKHPAPEGQENSADLRAGDATPPPQSEQVQSLDQWLRWIPDDPSGLLRRKFLIEHMMHQREAQQ